MNNTRTEIRRLMIALNKIDGIYYLIAKKSGTKENMLSLLYALLMENPIVRSRFVRNGSSPEQPSILLSKNVSTAVMLRLHLPERKKKI